MENQSVFILCFFCFFFTIFIYHCCSNCVRMETCYRLKILSQLPHFWPVLELTWLVLRIFTRWLLEGLHSQSFQVKEMKVNQKVGQKVKSRNANFHKWKEIWIYKRCLNRFPFQRRAWRKKTIVVSCDYLHPLCVIRVKKRTNKQKIKKTMKKSKKEKIYIKG